MANDSLIVQQVNKLAVKFNIPESTELVKVLRNTAFKGEVTDAQFSALLIVANQYGLNPWTREIYAFPDKNNGIVPVVGVDGWSRIINDHPQFDGMEFKQDDESCTCILYRKDRGHPISVTEYFSECYREAFKNKSGYEIKTAWQTHPKRMMRHKALIQCARIAFGYTGIFDQDEAERILEAEKDITPTDTSAAKPTPEKKYYTQAEFEAKQDGWKDVVASGKKTADDLITWVQGKGTFFTDAQRIAILTWKAPTIIEAEFTEQAPIDNDFVREMENAE